MGNGMLVVYQRLKDDGTHPTRIDPPIRLGVFCTVHSLFSWLEDREGGMLVPKRWGSPGRGGGWRKVRNADQRPKVYPQAKKARGR
jgi:hypothetical protein